MTKILLLTFILFEFSLANTYKITAYGVTLGKIHNFETINKGYLLAKPMKNTLFNLGPYKNVVFYEKNRKPYLKSKTKYKQDNYKILHIINNFEKYANKKTFFNFGNRSLSLDCLKSNCSYVKKNKDNSSKGYIKFENGKLLEFYDQKTRLRIKKI